MNLTNLKVAAPASNEPQTLHFGIRDDWPELVTIINKGLAVITPEEANDIHRRWVNIEYKPGINPGKVWNFVLRAAVIALLVLLIFAAWLYRLKIEIIKRKKTELQLDDARGPELHALDLLGAV